MTTTTTTPADALRRWNHMTTRYGARLEVRKTLEIASGPHDLGEDWELAAAQVSEIVEDLIDTAAPSLGDVISKLKIVIRHGHLDGRSDEIDHEAVRSEALTDRMLDGPWPLIRVLEDLERLQPTAAQNSETLRLAAESLEGWERRERKALDEAEAASEAGDKVTEEEVHLTQLVELDRVLEDAAKAATPIKAANLADLRNKGRILQVLTVCSRFGDFELEPWEEAFMASAAADVASLEVAQ